MTCNIGFAGYKYGHCRGWLLRARKHISGRPDKKQVTDDAHWTGQLHLLRQMVLGSRIWYMTDCP